MAKAKTPKPGSPTESNWINADALCKIIEACRANGVWEFSCGDLQLSFTPKQETKSLELEPVVGSDEDVPERPVFRDLEKERKELQDIRADEQMADLMISDPLAYEESLVRGANG